MNTGLLLFSGRLNFAGKIRKSYFRKRKKHFVFFFFVFLGAGTFITSFNETLNFETVTKQKIYEKICGHAKHPPTEEEEEANVKLAWIVPS